MTKKCPKNLFLVQILTFFPNFCSEEIPISAPFTVFQRFIQFSASSCIGFDCVGGLSHVLRGGSHWGDPPTLEWSQMEDMVTLLVSCLHHVAVEHISRPPESNNSKRRLQGRGFGGVEGDGGYPRPPEGSQMEDIVILLVSCFHYVDVERIYSLTGTNNSNRVRQGRGFGGFEGGRGTSDPL